MSNEKQQLVTEWLQEGLEIILTHEQQMQCIGLFEQAKEMEQAQHGNTWGNALSAITVDKWESFDQFYNETYGGNK
jgi:hypothetical protein